MTRFWLFWCLSLAWAKSPVVDLEYSKYRGSTANGISKFLGLRYAAPPVGDLRFAAPQDPPTTTGIQSATEFGDICIPVASKLNTAVPDKTSEDCLTLNVFTPADAVNSDTKLPVFFWIQGGGFSANSNARYDGSGLVEASGKKIVTVLLNYRVGPHGFLAGKEVKDGASLNNGLKDQIKALKWVQKHISKFGGDPDHVVIGGDSAGGASVTLLLSAYGGRDDKLFIGAAAESQSFGSMLNVSGSQFAYDKLVERTKCSDSKDTLACLRGTAASQCHDPITRRRGEPLFLYSPTIDGDLVEDLTLTLFHNGKFIKVPVIFGDDTNEGTVFVSNDTASVAEADTFLKNQFPNLTKAQLDKINGMYLREDQTVPFPDGKPYWRPASNAYGELRYICPGIDLSSIYAKAGVKSWNYHYDVKDPDAERDGTGVSHTVEVNALWGPENTHHNAPPSYSSTNAAIIPVVQGYWTSFIRSLDPNKHRDSSSPEWETWGTGKDAYKRIYIRTNQTKMEHVPQDQRDRCEYLIGIGEDLKQ
ncbi:Carboxylesterase type B [Penicillium capsulatum]|nr:Carboxylesterase type B [Penicillium capsulatum]